MADQVLKLNFPTESGAAAPEKVAQLPAPSSQDFDWNGADADMVVCNQQPETAVYSNTRGQVVIRQRATSYGDDDQFVIFDRDRLPRLIESLPVWIGMES